MTNVTITVRNDDNNGQLAEHQIYNQGSPWTEDQAREWVNHNESGEWSFVSVHSVPSHPEGCSCGDPECAAFVATQV